MRFKRAALAGGGVVLVGVMAAALWWGLSIPDSDVGFTQKTGKTRSHSRGGPRGPQPGGRITSPSQLPQAGRDKARGQGWPGMSQAEAVAQHQRRMALLERRYTTADTSKALQAGDEALFEQGVRRLREKFGSQVASAQFSCRGQQCRLAMALRSGRAIKAVATHAMWVGREAAARCRYDVVSEAGPPPVHRAQKLWMYYWCGDTAEADNANEPGPRTAQK